MKNYYLSTLCLFIFCTVGFSQNRITLIETFASSTCLPCNAANLTLEAILIGPANFGKHTSIRYPVDWPSPGDPYFTSEVNSRRSYYSVTTVPETHLDGGSGFDTEGITQSMLGGAYAVPPICIIDGFYDVDEAAQIVTITVDVIALEDFPGGTTLHCGIVEFTTTNNVKSNGETEFYNILKKMVPGTNGSIMSGIDMGDTAHIELTYTFNGTYILPPDAGSPVDFSTEHTVEEFFDIGVALWVQRITSKEVFQSSWAVYGYVGTDENEMEVVSAKIYPNPSSTHVAIAYTTTQEADVTIAIINTLGEIVYSNTVPNVQAGRTVEEVNTENFANGLYVVNISSASGEISRKLNIRK